MRHDARPPVTDDGGGAAEPGGQGGRQAVRYGGQDSCLLLELWLLYKYCLNWLSNLRDPPLKKLFFSISKSWKSYKRMDLFSLVIIWLLDP